MKWTVGAKGLLVCGLLLWGCNLSDNLEEADTRSEADASGEADSVFVPDANLFDGGGDLGPDGDFDVETPDGEEGDVEGDIDGEVDVEEDVMEEPEPCEPGACWEVDRAALTEVITLDDHRVIATGAHGFIARSEDGGETWRFVSPDGPSNLRPRPIARLEAGPGGAIFGVRDQTIVRSDDGGESFEVVQTPTDVAVLDIAIRPGTSIGYAAAGLDCEGNDCVSYLMLRSEDLLTWSAVAGPSGTRLERVWVGALGQIVTGSARTEWYFSNNDRQSWMPVHRLRSECDDVTKVLWNGGATAIAIGNGTTNRGECVLVDSEGTGNFERTSFGILMRRLDFVDGAWLDAARFVAMATNGQIVTTSDAGRNWSGAMMNFSSLGFFHLPSGELRGVTAAGEVWSLGAGSQWTKTHDALARLPLAMAFGEPRARVGIDSAMKLVIGNDQQGWEQVEDGRRYTMIRQSGRHAFANVSGLPYQLVMGMAWDGLAEIDLRQVAVPRLAFPDTGICGLNTSCTLLTIHSIVDAVHTGEAAVLLVHGTIRQTVDLTSQSFTRHLLMRSVNGTDWQLVREVPETSGALYLTASSVVVGGGWSDLNAVTWTIHNQDCGRPPFAYVEERDVLLSFGGERVCTSSNQGLTWTAGDALATVFGQEGVIRGFAHDGLELTVLLEVDEETTLLFVSQDGGESWERREVELPGGLRVYHEPGGVRTLVGPGMLYLREQR